MTAIVANEYGWYVGIQMTDFRSEMKFDSRDALLDWVNEDKLNRVIDSRCLDHDKRMYRVSVEIHLNTCVDVAAKDQADARQAAYTYFDNEMSAYDDNVVTNVTEVDLI